MSEASLEPEVAVAGIDVTGIDPTPSRPAEESDQSAIDRPSDAPDAKAMADIARFLSSGNNLPSNLQNVVDAMDRLCSALKTASVHGPNQKADQGEEPTASHRSADNTETQLKRYIEEVERLRKLYEGPSIECDKSDFLDLVAQKFVSFPYWNYQGPIFRFRLWPGPRLGDSTRDNVVISKHSDYQWVHEVSARFKTQDTWNFVPSILPEFCPPDVDESTLLRISWISAAGITWWITDDRDTAKRFGVGIDCSRSRTMGIDIIIFLARCFFVGRSHPRIGDPEGWSAEEKAFQHFILTFSNLSHPLARRALQDFHITRPHTESRSVLQYHLSYFAPVGLSANLAATPEIEGLVLERQFIKIRRVSHGPAKGGNKNEYQEQHFAERILSVSLVMNHQHGTFQLIVLGDAGASVDKQLYSKKTFDGSSSHDQLSLSMDCRDLGKAGGLSHFLDALVLLLGAWNQGWHDTLDAIDDIVGFNMDHTFDDSHLESYIFDTSSLMNLSKQYFTVLQLLRSARQRIDVNLAEWQAVCDTALRRREHQPISHIVKMTFAMVSLPTDEEEKEKASKTWNEQQNSVTELLKIYTERLKGRIERKTEEVESLRDGLFNATSLREASKGMALNRAIYVFTAVTIIYTPLGFMAALWALPILNSTPGDDNTHPPLVALIASFVAVPMLTYIACAYLSWYFTSTGESGSFLQSFKNFFRRLRGFKFPVRGRKAESTQVGHGTV